MIEIAGPERLPFDTIVRRYLAGTNDPRSLVTDPEARYFGLRLDDRSLVPGDDPRLGRLGFDEWLRAQSSAH